MTKGKRRAAVIVMDGVGLAPQEEIDGDAVYFAHTPTLDALFQNHPWIKLRAHGKAVGMPSDIDMGNSEVGHNALGCGQIYAQGAELVNEALRSGRVFQSKTWKEAVSFAKTHQGPMHFIGLLSDGNVHSHIDQLKALILQAKKEGISQVFVHALLDGRDVSPTSGLTYIQDLEDFFKKINEESFQGRIASGGGRMVITMDRYRANWPMVKKGWDTHVFGMGPAFSSAEKAYRRLHRLSPSSDQDLSNFVIVDAKGKPIGPIQDGASVILFNFRGDRAMELSMAFDQEDFPFFDRGKRPDVYFAGLLEYDGDLHIPRHYLIEPPLIEHTLTEFFVSKGVREFACSETQKFGHVSYFWNGNRSEKFSEELETWQEIPSDPVPFDQRPWMKSAEITDAFIQAMETEDYEFLRVNYANGDMVGHTGNFDAVRLAIESVDLALSRILPVAQKYNYVLFITADHGNAEDMIHTDEKTGKKSPKTAHSLNPVPFILWDPQQELTLDQRLSGKAGLANVAATVAETMGFKKLEIWEESLLAKSLAK